MDLFGIPNSLLEVDILGDIQLTMKRNLHWLLFVEKLTVWKLPAHSVDGSHCANKLFGLMFTMFVLLRVNRGNFELYCVSLGFRRA